MRGAQRLAARLSTCTTKPVKLRAQETTSGGRGWRLEVRERWRWVGLSAGDARSVPDPRGEPRGGGRPTPAGQRRHDSHRSGGR
jgi:hypothetical protein